MASLHNKNPLNALGRYELVRPLARGGMADVYLARRKVAGVEKRLVIKRMRRERVTDPRSLDLFVKEAQLSMALVQQNIVPVFDFGRIGEDVFLAMEHVDGKDLGSSLAQQPSEPLPHVMAAFIAAECCAALDHAHQFMHGTSRGIVHRDVTPRNILLSWSGDVKLADFGIAAAVGDAHRGIIGTPAYMAPEQARGEEVDGRADLYSLGLVLRELLTGQRVRSGDDRYAMVAQARTGELPPINGATMPDALRAIVERATATDAANRFASARDMLEALDTYIVAARAASAEGSPRNAITAWLAQRWPTPDDGNTPAEVAAAGAIVTFLDDGVAGVLGTATQHSVAVTADDEPAPVQAAPVISAAARQAPAAIDQVATVDVASSASNLPVAPPAPPAQQRSRVAIVAGLAVIASLGGVFVVGRRMGSRDASERPIVAVDARTAEPRSADAPTAEPRSADAPTAEPRSADARTAEPRSADARTAEPRSADARTAEPRSADARVHSSNKPDAPPTAVAATRTILLGAKPWANVSVDGGPAFETPARFDLTYGAHQAVFTNPELAITKRVTITVTDTSDTRFVVDLAAP